MQYQDFECQSKTVILLAKKRNNETDLFEFLDSVLSLFIFGPIAILFWASTWLILQNYIYEKNSLFGGLVTLSIGLTIQFFTYCFGNEFQRAHDKYSAQINSNEKKYFPISFLFRSIYTYILSVGIVSQWRAIWVLYDLSFANKFSQNYEILVLIFCLLINCLFLKHSLYSLTVVVPFTLNFEAKYETFFEKSKPYHWTNVSL
jgi:hypothetical protein